LNKKYRRIQFNGTPPKTNPAIVQTYANLDVDMDKLYAVSCHARHRHHQFVRPAIWQQLFLKKRSSLSWVSRQVQWVP